MTCYSRDLNFVEEVHNENYFMLVSGGSATGRWHPRPPKPFFVAGHLARPPDDGLHGGPTLA